MELDELYWFLEHKSWTETRENIYIMTMVSRKPRQIVGHVVSRNKLSRTIQRMVDAAPEGEADVFPGSWRTCRQFLLFLCRLTIVLAFKSIAIVPSIQGLLFHFLYLTSFNCVFGHSPDKEPLDSCLFLRYTENNFKERRYFA